MTSFDHASLERAVEAAWEVRDSITPQTGGRRARGDRDRRSRRSTRARSRAAERQADGAWKVNQWAKKAVLLGFRLQDMAPQPGGPQGGGWWDKVDFEVRGLDRARLARRRLPRRADRGGAPLGLHRPRRGADAVLRQPRRLRRRGDDGRHLGDGRLLRPDRPARAPLRRRRHRRRARAAAGGPDDHRGQLLHRRPLRGGRGLHRPRGLGARHGRLHRPVDEDRRPGDRRDLLRRGAALFGGGGRDRCPASPSPTATPGPGLYCAVIVKRVDERTRSKTGINELLRD